VVEWVDMAAVVWAATVEAAAQVQAVDLEVVPAAEEAVPAVVVAAAAEEAAVDDLKA
jgi:hypothetical protein